MRNNNEHTCKRKVSHGGRFNGGNKREHGGISTIDFDWFEEDACFDCEVQPYPEQFGEDDWRLVWNCEYCSGGNAELIIEK